MDEIIRLGTADFEEGIDFLNRVFSKPDSPVDFLRTLPKIYRAEEHLMNCNLAIRRDGRIRAVVGVFPMEVSISGRILKAAGIGGVSTHPEERGHGLMRRLMEAALADMAAKGVALSVLGGQRQRYNYYGYEKAGTLIHFTLSKTNIRHFFRGEPDPDYHFIRLDLVPGSSGDQQAGWLAQMKTWHDAQPFHICRATEDFALVLSSWRSAVWLALDPDGRPAGYLVSSSYGRSVSEFLTDSPRHLLPAAAAWVMRQTADDIRFAFPPWAHQAIRLFGTLCEKGGASHSYGINILDWPLVLSSLMTMKVRLESVPDGCLRMQVNRPCGPTALRLSVVDGRACCTENQDAAKPHVILDDLAATRLVLGPLAPSLAVPEFDQLGPEIRQILNAWFPLPCAWPEPDQI